MKKYNREYYRKNAERICEQQRGYYRAKKAKIQKYLEEKDNGVEMTQEVIFFFEELIRREYEKYVNSCRKRLNVYAYRSMQKVKVSCEKNVEVYYKKYPFDKYGEKHINKRWHCCN